MIKSHRPRGHIWTNASAFQQTKEFRNIDYEECLAPAMNVLVKDADHKLSESQRIAKRRRIEKLADEFLNGRPLFISSARRCPQSLAKIVSRSNNLGNGPNPTLSDADSPSSSQSSEELWRDVEDDDEILERLVGQLQERTKPRPGSSSTVSKACIPGESIEAVQVQASCKPARRLRPVTITSYPSEEALRQAAALRARKQSRANSEIPILHRHDSSPLRSEETPAEPRSEPRNATSRVVEEGQRDKWLSRRASRFSFSQYVAGDESEDELRLSRTEAPAVVNRKARTAASSRTERNMPSDEKAVNNDLQSLLGVSGDGFESEEPLQSKTSYDTAQEQVESGSDGLEGSGTRNPVTHTNSSKSTSLRDPLKLDGNGLAKGRHEKLLDGNYLSSSPPSRQTRSATARERINPISRAHSVYVSAPTSQNGSTPFKFRKRVSRLSTSGDSTTKATEKQKEDKQRKLTPCFDRVEVTYERPSSIREDKGTDRPVPPMLEVSLNDESEFARNLNNALENEQGDVMLSIIDDDGEARTDTHGHSQEERSSHNEETERNVDERAFLLSDGSESRGLPLMEQASGPSQVWAGTQFLLDKAQIDLWMSPEKQRSGTPKQSTSTPRVPERKAATESPRTTGRKPLKQLSQDVMPSTQQLLGDFNGWSTVKKPRFGPRRSPLQTSTSKSRGNSSRGGPSDSTPIPSTAPPFKNALDVAAREQRVLKFSMSSTAPPHDASTLIESSTGSQNNGNSTEAEITPAVNPKSTDALQLAIIPSGTKQVSVSDIQPVENETTLTRLSPSPGISSFEAAQHSQLNFWRESSDLSQTVNDLHDMLDTTEMDGVWSQGGW